ncbi:hypothetical protein BpHYR1_013176 [Brachionus plicatilis]|uniref:Uncharacterized protein n=1 Tax=Brachionus plicatilis TaxID=10195 RepID=A0A3M7P632_BRAPC|nr:hypothetical protein BpHYR1_013176 [Brachionus plicatilis]
MLNKLSCINANVSLDLSKISRASTKKSYKQKFKRKLFRMNKSKSSHLISSTLASQSLPKYTDDFSDYSDDSDSDVSLNSLLDEDLNSSVSSVSSLECEPFEYHQKKVCKSSKTSFVRGPLLSSSRTSLVKKSSKLCSFDPRFTSSRKNLFHQKANCSKCHVTTLPNTISGYFSFIEEQICSSTHVSIDFKEANNSESVFTNSSIFSLSKSNSDLF